MRSKKDTNILDQKKQSMERLVEASVHAVDVVKSMISNLQSINDQIETQKAEIDTYIEQLSATRVDLNTTKEKNDRVMGNIKKMFELDD